MFYFFSFFFFFFFFCEVLLFSRNNLLSVETSKTGNDTAFLTIVSYKQFKKVAFTQMLITIE